MSYALMLFEELFASQLSVPSSPVHPIKCTTIQMKETEMSDKTETKEGKKTKIMTNSGNTERREIIKKKKYRKEICIVSSRTRHDTCVSHKLHPVYIVRTMICSYFGISFFGFAKNVYLQILYENIYIHIYIEKKTGHMKYKVLKSSSGIVNPFDRIQARFFGVRNVAPQLLHPPRFLFENQLKSFCSFS